MPFLIEIQGVHRQTRAQRTFRFTDIPGGYRTKPNEIPSNVYFYPRPTNVGSYTRTLFGRGGRTNGTAQVDRGSLTLNNSDDALSEMEDYAFDGYEMTISQIASADAPFASRTKKLTGTMEQIEVTYDEVSITLRSRLALLDKPLQTALFAGTTTDGTKIEAEGDQNLKGAPKPLLFGAPRNISPILVNRFRQVYKIGEAAGLIVSVRDRGALLTAGTNYATLAELFAATVAAGTYATCRNEGLIRIGGNVQGQITVDASSAAVMTDNRAGTVVSQILTRMGMVLGTDFLAADIQALNDLQYQVGYYTGTQEVTALAAISFILDSVGAFISPNALGVFRLSLFREPTGPAKKTFTVIEIEETGTSGIQKINTGDDGRGIPAKKVTVRHTFNYTVQDEGSLSGTVLTSDTAFVAFTKEEWRQEISLADASIEAVHKLAPEIEFETALIRDVDAKAVANQRVVLYGTKRIRLRVPIHVSQAIGIDLADVIALAINRFGIQRNAPKLFVVIGITEDLTESITTLDLWG